MGWVNFAQRNQERRTILGAFLPSYKPSTLQRHSIARTMGVLDRLSFVFVGLEYLNLEGMVGAFV